MAKLYSKKCDNCYSAYRGRGKKYCSELCKIAVSTKNPPSFLGKKHSEKSKRRISLSLRGRTPKNMLQIAGWNRGNIKPDVGYVALHEWVRKKLGKPDVCVKCSKSGLKGRKIHWANKSGEYLISIKDWIRLCASCHKKYDIKYGFKRKRI